jgi:hypothetical protein
MNRDEQNEIHGPADFAISAETVLNLHKRIRAKRSKPLDGRIIDTDVFPFLASDVLFHFDYLLFFLCEYIITQKA